MMRIQIQLETSQHRQVKRRARHLGVSVSEVIRRCVDAQLRSEEAGRTEDPVRRLLAVAGKYADPSGDRQVAADHDAVLAEAYRR